MVAVKAGTMFKRSADHAYLDDTPAVAAIPAAAAGTPAELVDLALVADEAKRRRTTPNDPAPLNDAHVAVALQKEHDAFLARNPAFRALVDLPAQMAAQLGALGGRVAAVAEQLALVGDQNVVLGRQLEELRNVSAPARVAALFENSVTVNEDSALTPVPRVTDLAVPVVFPPTLGAFRQLAGPQVNHLLEFYELPVDGGVAARRARLGGYLHVNVRR